MGKKKAVYFCDLFDFFWWSKILTYFNPENNMGVCHRKYNFCIDFENIGLGKQNFNMKLQIVVFLFFWQILHPKISRFSKIKIKKKKNQNSFIDFFFLNMSFRKLKKCFLIVFYLDWSYLFMHSNLKFVFKFFVFFYIYVCRI